ncbi:MAG: type II secretion system protein N [Oceanococcaceae bacterium]
MRKVLGGGLLLMGGFAAGLVYLAPANKLLGLAGWQQSPQLQIHGVHGRLLHGRIDRLHSPQMPVDNLHWWLRPSALLLAQAKLKLDLRWGGGISAQGFVSRGLTAEDTQLSDWKTRFPLARLQPLLRLPLLPLEGELDLSLEQASLNDQGRPTAVSGEVLLRGLRWTLLKPAAALGDYALRVSTQDDGTIVGELQDVEAALGAQGSISLNPEGRYVVDLRLSPRPNTPPMIRNSLPTVGKLGSDGSYALRYEGRVPNW